MTTLLVIIGSSRSDTPEADALRHVLDAAEAAGCAVQLVDLSSCDIGYYQYDGGNMDDDFLSIAERIPKVDGLLFATPVYWYSMSAQLKTFMDRLTDLITVRKELGRALAGRKLSVVSWGYEAALPEGYEVPFARTADYFDMGYGGCFYYCTAPDADVEQRQLGAARFGQMLAERS